MDCYLNIHFINLNYFHFINIAQLNEIRKSSMARLLCDNSNHVQSIQPQAFLRVSPK